MMFVLIFFASVLVKACIWKGVLKDCEGGKGDHIFSLSFPPVKYE